MIDLPWKYIIPVLALLALAGSIAWVVIDHFNGDAAVEAELVDTKDDLEDLQEEARAVTIATRNAADNPELQWSGVADQVSELGASRRLFLDEIEELNLTLEERARMAAQNAADAAEQRAVLERALAQKEAALRRLREESLTPAEAADCDTLIREADRVQELLYGIARDIEQ